jgi:hypothetical protein
MTMLAPRIKGGNAVPSFSLFSCRKKINGQE